METLRCPACFFMLSDPGASRCPSCNKKLRRGRGRPIVLGDKTHFGTHAPTDIDLLLAERDQRDQRAQASSADDPVVAAIPAPPEAPMPPVADAPDLLQHTTMFEPSQFDRDASGARQPLRQGAVGA